MFLRERKPLFPVEGLGRSGTDIALLSFVTLSEDIEQVEEEGAASRPLRASTHEVSSTEVPVPAGLGCQTDNKCCHLLPRAGCTLLMGPASLHSTLGLLNPALWIIQWVTCTSADRKKH